MRESKPTPMSNGCTESARDRIRPFDRLFFRSIGRRLLGESGPANLRDLRFQIDLVKVVSWTTSAQRRPPSECPLWWWFSNIVCQFRRRLLHLSVHFCTAGPQRPISFGWMTLNPRWCRERASSESSAELRTSISFTWAPCPSIHRFRCLSSQHGFTARF